MKNKIVKFELDPKTVKVKELLNKDFLELEIKAISTANPNRNNSAFTLESLKKAIPTFYNKPILGSFSVAKDDFKAHEGELCYDKEYEQLYYDYTGAGSEIPLGLIRGDDEVKIVHSKKDGLDWVVFTCAIWVKYNYKQVKKILKSKDGHKKISVEIEVLDSEFDENGVEQIKDFNFDGVTILGDDYETGIADASMTILDMVDSALFQKQQKCLVFAYDDFEKNKEVKEEQEEIEEDSIKNEDSSQILMEDNEKKKKGGVNVELTMKEKLELLKLALEVSFEELKQKGTSPFDYCHLWPFDLDDSFVYYECCELRFRCPYIILETETEDGRKKYEAVVDMESQEQVVLTYKVFSEEESKEKEEFDHPISEDHNEEICHEMIIRSLISEEEEAIQSYLRALERFEEEQPDIAKVLLDIKTEEERHVGELQQCLQLIDSEALGNINEGVQEAENLLQEEQEQEVPQEDFVVDGLKSDADNDPEDSDEQEDIDGKEAPSKDDDEDSISEDKEEEPLQDSDEDDEEDKENDSDDFGCEKECRFESQPIDTNEEPEEIVVEDLTMSEIIAASTQSVGAPEVQTEVKDLGDANQEVAQVLGDIQQEIVSGKALEEADKPVKENTEEGSDKTPEASVEQPDDSQKERGGQFSSDIEVNGEMVSIQTLVERYNELAERLNAIDNTVKEEQIESLIIFAKRFVSADEFIDSEAKENFIAQITEKCKNNEFSSEEEVSKFAKDLMAMYYYEHLSVQKPESSIEFTLSLNKPTNHDGNASSNKLKDAIHKLNHLE